MTPSEPTLPRLVMAGLRWLASPERADALVGDLEEALARRLASPHPPRAPRLWLATHLAADLSFALWSSARIRSRAYRHVLRDASRSLRRTPGATLLSLAILTLGMAGATVTFSVVDAVILRPLPFGHQTGLVAVGGPTPIVSPLEFKAWRDHVPALAGLAAVEGGIETLRTADKPALVRTAAVSANLFDVLGASPRLGHLFTRDDEAPGRELVGVVSYPFWRDQFGSDPNIIGKRLALRTGVVTVIGVMPEGFTYPIDGAELETGLWTPLVPNPDEERREAGGIVRYLTLVGRLQPGATTDMAKAELATTLLPLVGTHAYAYTDWHPSVVPLEDAIFGPVRGWMLLVLGAVVLVMAVVCVNVANLLLVRSAARARELAIRTALGATRRTLLVELLVESLILAIAAASLGVLVSIWGLRVARAALPSGIARASTIALDLRVLTVVALAAVATGILFGTVPAWLASRTDVLGLLKEAAHTVSPGRRRWRAAFLATEVAFVGLLLVTTTLFVTSFGRITHVDLGFDRSHLLYVDTRSAGPVPADRLAQAIRPLPGVESVGFINGGSPPLIDRGSSTSAYQRADSPLGAQAPILKFQTLRVSPDYFGTARIPLRAGGVFASSTADVPTAVMVDTVAARALFGGENPIGQTLQVPGYAKHLTVAGVVEHVRDAGPESPGEPLVYLPLHAHPLQAGLIARATGDPARLVPALTAAATTGMSPTQKAAVTVAVFEDHYRELTADRRFNAGLLAAFGLLALVIGATGIYGVMGSSIEERRHEIGIRVALGANRSRVRGELLGGIAASVGLGLTTGLAAGWVAARFFRSLLFEVRASEPGIYLAVAAIVIAVGLTTALAAARRASSVDPIEALRPR